MQIAEIDDHVQQCTHATLTISLKGQIFWRMTVVVFHRDSLSLTGNFGGIFRSAAVPCAISWWMRACTYLSVYARTPIIRESQTGRTGLVLTTLARPKLISFTDSLGFVPLHARPDAWEMGRCNLQFYTWHLIESKCARNVREGCNSRSSVEHFLRIFEIILEQR